MGHRGAAISLTGVPELVLWLQKAKELGLPLTQLEDLRCVEGPKSMHLCTDRGPQIIGARLNLVCGGNANGVTYKLVDRLDSETFCKKCFDHRGNDYTCKPMDTWLFKPKFKEILGRRCNWFCLVLDIGRAGALLDGNDRVGGRVSALSLVDAMTREYKGNLEAWADTLVRQKGWIDRETGNKAVEILEHIREEGAKTDFDQTKANFEASLRMAQKVFQAGTDNHRLFGTRSLDGLYDHLVEHYADKDLAEQLVERLKEDWPTILPVQLCGVQGTVLGNQDWPNPMVWLETEWWAQATELITREVERFQKRIENDVKNPGRGVVAMSLNGDHKTNKLVEELYQLKAVKTGKGVYVETTRALGSYTQAHSYGAVDLGDVGSDYVACFLGYWVGGSGELPALEAKELAELTCGN